MPDTLAAPDVGIFLLESPSNFAAWSRDIQAIARHKGLWDLISGEEKILERPYRDDQTDYQKSEQSHRYLLDGFKEQQERIRLASTMIIYSVAPSIRRSIFHFTKPQEMYEDLKKQFQVSDYRAREAARTRMDSIRLSLDKSLSSLIDELVQCKLDINEAKGTCSDEDVIHKIKACLPREYDEFIQKDITFADDPPDLADIKKKLLLIEQQMRELG